MNDVPRDWVQPAASILSNGRLAEMACLLEVTARKPGNVHRFRDFKDLHFVDFLLSATAVAAPLDRARIRGWAHGTGRREATRQVVSTNTNLGMILLLAPLAAVPRGVALAEGVEQRAGGNDKRRCARCLPGDPARCDRVALDRWRIRILRPTRR